MKKAILQEVQHKQDDFLLGLKKVMKVNSCMGEPKEHAPFGCGPKKAVEKALKLAEEMGFQTKMVNDAVGYVQYGEDNENYIGVLGHLDVVPAGDGWDYVPFDLTLSNGILYGRGILDNKGPILSCLYGLKILKDLHIPLSKTIRIMFGSNEESGSKDIPLYLSEEKAPMYGFTPDCKYPVVYGERGVVDVTIKTPITDHSLEVIKSIHADFTKSSVPDKLEVHLANSKTMMIQGKRSPSNAPELGENAITKFAVIAIKEGIVYGECLQYMHWMVQKLHDNHHGEGLEVAFSDEASGQLILTPYKLSIEDNNFVLSISFRYPISTIEKDILAILQEKVIHNSVIHINRSLPSTKFPLDHPMLKTMQRVYEECTGLDGTPVITTGATYARYMPNIIAFGPSFPGQKGIAHNKNEYMAYNDLMKNLEIYTLTMYELAK